MNRLARMVAVTVALLCLFTVGAGAAIAHLLPARLALFQLPTISGTSRAGSGTGLRSATDPDPGATAKGHPSASAVSALLSAPIGSGSLGQQVGALVVDDSTGQVLYALNPDSGYTPASTTKVATAVAAIDTLGPSARFTTSVRLSGSNGIVLVGGGDPTLAAGRYPASFYPQPANLYSLAALTARALRAKGMSSVRLTFDNSLFTGPTLALGWPGFGAADNYISSGNVAPIVGLEVDQGRLTGSGRPEDTDDSSNQLPRSMRPGLDAATAFARFLRKDGITVANTPVASRPTSGAQPGKVIAAIQSPPLAQIVQWMLQESNNVIAETLARHVAIATGKPPTFAGAGQAVMAVDAQLGVHGLQLNDGSGLSPLDTITPRALVKLVELAAGQQAPKLRPVITGLPVAGFSGTLGPGSFFGPFGPDALGTVRAKTGNLTGVATMAGLAYAKDGDLLAFAFMGNGIGKKLGVAPESTLSQLATDLAGCGCR